MTGKTFATCVLLTGIVILGIATARSQGSGSSRVNPPQQPRRPQTFEEFARDLWQFLNRPDTGFTTWKTVEGAGPVDAGSPHGSPTKSYVNSIAAGNLQAPAFGSILVRENFAQDQKTRPAVSVMYRVQGADPKNFDWYWLQYLPDGSVAKAPEGGKPLGGRVTSCIECHQKSKGGDLVFLNDLPAVPGK